MSLGIDLLWCSFISVRAGEKVTNGYCLWFASKYYVTKTQSRYRDTVRQLERHNLCYSRK